MKTTLVTTTLVLAISLAGLSMACLDASSPAHGGGVAHTQAGPLAVGTSLPALSGRTLDGSAVDREALLGKTALINFWFYH